MECEENNRPFDNWTNGISYGLSYESPHDLFLDSIRDIMIQTWNRNMVDPWGSLNGWTDSWFVKWNSEWFNRRFDGGFDEWFNDWMCDLINII